MRSEDPPKVLGIEVVAAQPSTADSGVIAQIAKQRGPAISVVYLVKLRLEKPVSMVRGTVCIGESQIPGGARYKDGIYFKVYNRKVLEDHQGQPITFVYDDGEIIETGLALPGPPESGLLAHVGQALHISKLPTQEEALRQGTS